MKSLWWHSTSLTFCRLQILYLGGNHLQHLPGEIGKCRDLQSLILCDNRLSVLPHSLSQLHKLQSLSLHSNRLATLPPGIVNLQLVELSLRNNPLVVSITQLVTSSLFTHQHPLTPNLNINRKYTNSADQRCMNKLCVVIYGADEWFNSIVSLNSMNQCNNNNKTMKHVQILKDHLPVGPKLSTHHALKLLISKACRFFSFQIEQLVVYQPHTHSD